MITPIPDPSWIGKAPEYDDEDTVADLSDYYYDQRIEREIEQS